MSGAFSPQAMVDFLWWATHVLTANLAISADDVRAWLPCYPLIDRPKSDVVFELSSGRVYSNHPTAKWLDADKPKQWRDTLLDGAPLTSLTEKFPCGQMSCCLFNPVWDDGE